MKEWICRNFSNEKLFLVFGFWFFAKDQKLKTKDQDERCEILQNPAFYKCARAARLGGLGLFVW
jgi:hypothetical protein